jgi:hypothetical protein
MKEIRVRTGTGTRTGIKAKTRTKKKEMIRTLGRHNDLVSALFNKKEHLLVLFLIVSFLSLSVFLSLFGVLHLSPSPSPSPVTPYLICPSPKIIYLSIVNSFKPTGPLAWSFWLLMPISAPKPNS